MFNDPQSPSIYSIIDCVMPDLGFIWIYSSLFHPNYFMTGLAFLIKEFESVYRNLRRLNFIRDEGTSSQNQNILR